MRSVNCSNHHDHSIERYTMSSSRGKRRPSLLQRKGRERHLPRVLPQKSATLFFNSPSGPKKNCPPNHRPLGAFLWDYRADVSRAHDEIMLNISSSDRRLVRQLSVSEFSIALGLYTEEFKEENDLHALNCHIHRPPSGCWDALEGERALVSSTLTMPTFYGHEDPASQAPRFHRPVHVVASYADISECLTRFEQQWF
ncbi:hypothetical protein GOBAR_AA29967 [Gossypium barbadense]|uniref:Uncharacterized protein n=1 Tax=Gossypium barbadense TaxID=3634 RepID=A0A2P5WI06_GOSBA|nr:hypothetical protein GOBAR_AA29967 [Gossypium barbadense]